ncbi:MAG: enoyl-[acyl-carrier-protein] reductase FabI [Gammaproteobacteria bacterium CG11_big_fil_rev_8_21_14_0_20_46_22]|nr:MAG: enoyl-[acyl-carrier-protein] reductase FabI [Gammaproteobacteria bacterium CG12_big_fil_rev_8_21_14_0_65_46_12]PIR10182.1 MAG: enoyl-[acyl-carrier-protein] reductase FabI [Gammaproteobacteria bacterium CG11_big_fil_rev_8_21_14_0_20_46_22]
MGFLQGKRALIVGLLSNKSIAYGIANAMHEQGAELAFTYQDERFRDRIEKMTAEWDSRLFFKCDLTQDQDISDIFTALKKEWDGIDIIVHSAAFAPADQLEGDYLDCVTREGFTIAHDISSYSFAALAKAAKDFIRPGGALLTMTYQGAERAVTNYNVMGIAKASLEANVRYMAASLGPKNIRVNAISAGPIRTLAASGIKDFRKMLSFNEKIVPLRRNVSIEDVGNTAAFLCSNLASGITGEIVHVDSGYHAVSIGALED